MIATAGYDSCGQIALQGYQQICITQDGNRPHHKAYRRQNPLPIQQQYRQSLTLSIPVSCTIQQPHNIIKYRMQVLIRHILYSLPVNLKYTKHKLQTTHIIKAHIKQLHNYNMPLEAHIIRSHTSHMACDLYLHINPINL